jgi:hypothetical protein
MSVAAEQGTVLLEMINCPDDIECLRAADVNDIVTAQFKIDGEPTWDHPVDIFYPWAPVGNLFSSNFLSI